MDDHADVRTAVKNTNDFAMHSGLTREVVRDIRGETSRDLRDSISRSMKTLTALEVGGNDALPFRVGMAVTDEEMCARIAVASMVLRERLMSDRLDRVSSVEDLICTSDFGHGPDVANCSCED